MIMRNYLRSHKKPAGMAAAIALSVLAVQAAAPMTARAVSPEFARTEEEWARLRDDVLEYEEIEDLIHEYNVTVRNNYEDWKKNSAGKTPEDIVRDAERDIDSYYEASANAEDDITTITSDMQGKLAESTLQRTIDSAEDGQTRKWEYDKVEKSLAVQAQTLMNSYYQLQLQLEAAQKNRQLLENMVGIAQRQQSASVGMATQSDVLTAQQNLQNAEAQIISLESQIASTRQNLIVMLGWAQDASPEIRPMPETDLNRISSMNPQTDLETAYTNDYTLLTDQRKMENAATYDVRQIYASTIENDKQQIAVALNTAYQAVLQAKSTYDQAVLDLDIANKNYDTAVVKQQIGMGTALETLQAEAAQVSARVQQQVTSLQLFQAMETYDWVTKGVRS